MNLSTPQPPATGDRLKTREYIGYALGDTASNFFFQTFNIFLTYYYVDVWGIPATALLWMMPIVRLVGAFDDPIIGILSDEATAPGQPNFTGAFVGMACQDLAGTSHPADFDFFEYRERSYRPNLF